MEERQVQEKRKTMSKIKIYLTQVSGLNGPVAFAEEFSVIEELKFHIEELSIGDTFTVTVAEMTQEDFDALADFEGY